MVEMIFPSARASAATRSMISPVLSVERSFTARISIEMPSCVSNERRVCSMACSSLRAGTMTVICGLAAGSIALVSFRRSGILGRLRQAVVERHVQRKAMSQLRRMALRRILLVSMRFHYEGLEDEKLSRNIGSINSLRFFATFRVTIKVLLRIQAARSFESESNDFGFDF